MTSVVEKKLISHYRRLASKYDTRFSSYLDRVIAKIIEKTNLQPSDKILDIGCGTGELLIKMYRAEPRVGELAGIDASEAMLRQAEKKLKNMSVVRLRHGDILQLSYPKHYFNIITMTGVAHYLSEPDLRVVLENARECLMPGGRILVADIASDSVAMRLGYILKRILDPATISLYSMKSITDLFVSAGFEVTDTELFHAGIFDLYLVKAQPRESLKNTS